MNSEPTREPIPEPTPPLPETAGPLPEGTPAPPAPLAPALPAAVPGASAAMPASVSAAPVVRVRRIPIPGPAIDRGTWATRFIILTCLGLWLRINWGKPPELMTELEPYGVRMADEIWNGAYWALWPSALIHIDIWHVVLNMMATLTLGGTMERTVGPWKLLLFCATAAPITAGIQLAASGTTGIGFSGVVFAIFGFLWAGVGRYPEFRRVIHRANLVMILGWLVLCFFVTWAGILPIANAAHVAGLLWGLAVGQAFAARRWIPAGVAGALAMVLAVVVSLFWAPWLNVWLGYRAEQAAQQDDYDTALRYIDTVLERDPDTEWARRYRRQLLWLQQRDSATETL